MKKTSYALEAIRLVSLAACLNGLPLRVDAGVYDDCAAWWHFDYDPNANGLADTDEIRDQRDWGTAATPGATGHHATASHGPLGTPAWTNDVVSPACGGLYGHMSMAFNPTTNELGLCYPDTFKVDNFLLYGSATIVTRFRWDGYTLNSDNPGWIYNNGLGWNENNGWMFGVRSDGNNRLGMWLGHNDIHMTSAVIEVGKWYEAAAVLTDNGDNDTVEFYLWPDGGTLIYEKINTSAVASDANTFVGTTVGAEMSATTYSDGNAYKAFKGAINHIAVWSRALRHEEVVQAFCSPQPLFEIGLNNNKAEDLRLESETDGTYTVGDPWHTMPRAVTPAMSDASIKLPLTDVQKNLNYVFHVKTLTYNGQAASLSLIVNTTTNEAKSATNGQDLYWYVTANTLLTGTNTFTLHYAGGDSPHIAFDWMELGGAWQIGYADDNQSEFSNESLEPDDFYVNDTNWLHMERAVVLGSDSNTVIHFFLSPEMAAKFRYVYTTRVILQGVINNTFVAQFPFSICINNQHTISYPGQPDNTSITVPLDRSVIQAGENTINLMYNGPQTADTGGGWLQFDFHRLEVKEYPKGTAILVH